jgi:NAD(P)H-hydrate epimerase
MAARIPAITVDQVRQMDRLMVEDFCLSLPQMRELAGYHLAALARRWQVSGRRVFVAAGRGPGGGLVAARHLSSWGAGVTVAADAERALAAGPRLQGESLQHLPVDRGQGVFALTAPLAADVCVDAVMGYGLDGASS